MISYNRDTLCGPFLYRDNIPGCSDANTMATSLNMNGKNIDNASNVSTDDLYVKNSASLGATTVNGEATFNGQTTASNGMDVKNGMAVSGNADFNNNVNMAGGNLNATNMNVSNVQAQQIKTNNLDTGAMTVNGAMIIDDSLSVNGNMNVNNPGSQMLVGSVNTGNVDASSGAINVGTMNIQNTMNVTGNFEIVGANRELVLDHLTAEQCVKTLSGQYGPGC